MEKSRYELYYVGGYVRDKILGVESKDIDFTFVINKKPNEKIDIDEGFKLMENWLKYRNFSIFLSTPNMLTIRAKFPENEDNMVADFVLARREVYSNTCSRFPVVELGTLEDDLMRRDFTVNALAMDMSGNIIDICNGIEDIKFKRLRTPRDPIQTFIDDPLRVLRAMRFYITKNFSLVDIINTMVSEEILNKLFTTVSIERIREELTKMFNYSTPETLKLLIFINEKCPNFLDRLFEGPLKLLPTTKIK